MAEFPPLVVFTDLDGTLLEHHTYDWLPARPALAALAARGAQVVLASSKTRAEIEVWRARTGLSGPFISENGGALFAPSAEGPPHVPGAVERGGYRVVMFGTPWDALRDALRAIEAALGVRLRGFGDLALGEITALTGLAADDAALAARREFDEPFVPERALTPEEEARLEATARARGLRITRGGRFHHLLGPSHKGRAARALMEAWAMAGATPPTMALGDGANDLELLEVADHPVVVARPDGSHAPALRAGLQRARFTRAPGPAGFAEAVLEHLAADD